MWCADYTLVILFFLLYQMDQDAASMVKVFDFALIPAFQEERKSIADDES